MRGQFSEAWGSWVWRKRAYVGSKPQPQVNAQNSALSARASGTQRGRLGPLFRARHPDLPPPLPPPAPRSPQAPAQGGRENPGQGRGPWGVSGSHTTSCVLWELEWRGLTPLWGSGLRGREPGPKLLGAAIDDSDKVTVARGMGTAGASILPASLPQPRCGQLEAGSLAEHVLLCAKVPTDHFPRCCFRR